MNDDGEPIYEPSSRYNNNAVMERINSAHKIESSIVRDMYIKEGYYIKYGLFNFDDDKELNKNPLASITIHPGEYTGCHYTYNKLLKEFINLRIYEMTGISFNAYMNDMPACDADKVKYEVLQAQPNPEVTRNLEQELDAKLKSIKDQKK